MKKLTTLILTIVLILTACASREVGAPEIYETPEASEDVSNVSEASEVPESASETLEDAFETLDLSENTNDCEVSETAEDVSELADFSDFLIVRAYSNMAQGYQYHATVISADGTVKELNMAELFQNCQTSADDIILNCMDDDSIPVLDNIKPIPETIIEAARELGDFELDVKKSAARDAGSYATYVTVGTGDARTLVEIGAYGDWTYSSSDKTVNALYKKVCKYAGFNSSL